jgi:hypothetical protein
MSVLYDILNHSKSIVIYRLFLATNREFALWALDNQSIIKRLLTEVYQIGNKTVYILNNKYHREDGPAVDLPNYKEYLIHGVNHRDGDDPAIVYPHLKMWYKNGLQHRDGDLPAIIGRSTQIYMRNDRKHRDGGLPAVITPYAKEWWVDGVRIK